MSRASGMYALNQHRRSLISVVQAFRPAVIVREIARQTCRSANTQLGVAKRVAGDIGLCLGLGPKSATREVAGSAFCPLTRVTPPAIVCWIDRSGVHVARRALPQPAVGHAVLIHPRYELKSIALTQHLRG